MTVNLYSTPSCTYCRLAKDFFRKEGIGFNEYDVSRDRRRADEMIRKTGQMGVPVIEIGSKVIVGFNQAEIRKALGR